jgi:hypothetical protein
VFDEEHLKKYQDQHPAKLAIALAVNKLVEDPRALAEETLKLLRDVNVHPMRDGGPASRMLFRLLDRAMLVIMATQIHTERRHAELVRRVQELER